MKKEVFLIIGIVVMSVLLGTNPVIATPTAENFGIADAEGYKNTYVEVPVYVTSTSNGVISSIIFNVEYDTSVISIVDVETAGLTEFWDSPSFNNFEWGTRVSIVGETEIPIGSSGLVALVNFSVSGDGWSSMELNDIQLAGAPDYQLGTATAENGLFTVLTEGVISGTITDNTGAELSNVIVTLPDFGIATMTNETGSYNFTGVQVGDYYLELTKQGYWSNTVNITVISGRTTIMDTRLPLKGDFNNNALAVDAGDLAMTKEASVGKIGL